LRELYRSLTSIERPALERYGGDRRIENGFAKPECCGGDGAVARPRISPGAETLEITPEIHTGAPPLALYAVDQATARIRIEGRQLDVQQLSGVSGRQVVGR
jgi:hypothetical protein